MHLFIQLFIVLNFLDRTKIGLKHGILKPLFYNIYLSNTSLSVYTVYLRFFYFNGLIFQNTISSWSARLVHIRQTIYRNYLPNKFAIVIRRHDISMDMRL